MTQNSNSDRRFHTERTPVVGEDLALRRDQSRHLARVLRIGQGATIRVFTGEGDEFEGTVRRADPERSVIRIDRQVKDAGDDSMPALTLAFAPPKGGRADFLVEKATELGVERLQPLLCERLEHFPPGKADKRCSRWERKVTEAAKQSRRAVVPKVEAPLALERYMQDTQAETHLVGRVVAQTRSLWAELGSVEEPTGAIAVVIGPAGGFTARELSFMNQAGWRGFSLGPHTLRTETAAIAALACISAWAHGREENAK